MSEIQSHADTAPVSISVVVPAYNARRFIARALDSALAQDVAGMEVIVVDDGSSDGTRELVASYAEVRLLRHERRMGAAAARNTGIAAACGDYVAFLDADDEWLPGKLKHQLAVIAADPGMTFITCRANLVDEYGRDTGDIYRGARPAEGDGGWRTLLAYPCVATPSVLARRAALVTAGGFNKWLPVGEDQDMWIRLGLMGRIGHLPVSLVRVHSTPNSLSKSRFREQASYVLPMIIAYVERNRGALSRAEIRTILGERFAKLGQLAYVGGEPMFGIVTLLRAMGYGHQPLGNLLYILRASGVMRWVKRCIQTNHGVLSRAAAP